MTDKNHSGNLTIGNSTGEGVTIALLGGLILLLGALTVLAFLVKKLIAKRGLPGSRRDQFQSATTTELAEDFIKLKVQGPNQGNK